MSSFKSDIEPILSKQDMEEKEWVQKVREQGNRDAFEMIFRTYYKRLHGYAYTFLKKTEVAEDVVQSVFLRIWTQKESWDPPGTVKQYLFTAVRNSALNKIRHQKVVRDAKDEILRSFQENETQVFFEDDSRDMDELRCRIQQGIDELPTKCRQIFLLNRRSGLTYMEIADYLEISINTVNTQMGRALRSLRDHLSEHFRAIVATGITNLFF